MADKRRASSEKRDAGGNRLARQPVAFYLVCLILVAVIPAFLFSILVLLRAAVQKSATVAAA